MDYDVIIAGASFAGLAAAAQLRGKRVLVIEPNSIGSGRTSACATPLTVLEVTGMLESLRQVHDRLVLHLPQRTYHAPLPIPYCTFDYQIFCNRLLALSDAEVLRASVLRHRGHLVYTSRGAFDAIVLIDGSGWRAALATNGQLESCHHPGKSFGLETNVPVHETGLHFWYDPTRLQPKNFTWLFSAGPESRAGLASYLGRTRLKEGLVTWLQTEFGQAPESIHGGYFPYRRRPATTGYVFRVGDAAGQCYPLTGEGIRPALHFGMLAGSLARDVIDCSITESEALSKYRARVRASAPLHSFLLCAQKFLTSIPVTGVDWLARFVHHWGLLLPFLKIYCRLMNSGQIAVPDDRIEQNPLIKDVGVG